jgi:hypothetical protein
VINRATASPCGTATFQASFNRPVYKPTSLVGANDIIQYLRKNNFSILAVDLNNCLMDQRAGIVRASKGRLTLSDLDEWDKDNSAKMEMSREAYLRWAWANPFSELMSEPFDGAAQAIYRIRRAGIKVWIVTASVMSKGDITGWLDWNGIVFDRIIKTGDKRGIGDCLIDDSPTTCQKFFEAGLPILRYELAWNGKLDYVKGVKWL